MAEESIWKVVFMDDEADIREVAGITLRDAGYDVLLAEDGEAGLALCDREAPQIVITDVRMPKMSGIEVLEALKKRHPHMEVIVATAYGDMSLAVRALQLDASDFITKPIHMEALHTALMRARQRYGARKQLTDYTALLETENAGTLRELEKSIAYRRNLIENSMDGILGCDEGETVVAFNRSMERMLGYRRAEVVGTASLSLFFLPGDREKLREALAGETHGGENRLFLYESTLVGQGGRQVPVQVSAAVLTEGGKAAGSVFFFRDLREIRRLEQAHADHARILHQDKMISLGRLAASVVHEINNPLSGILNYLKLMGRILDRGPLDEAYREKFRSYLELVTGETDRCSNIISSLLTFSRKSPPAFDEVRIDELLNRCMTLSGHKLELHGIRPTCAVDPGLPPVTGDLNQLQQCIINLVFNAVDAMPGGGELTLSGALGRDAGWVEISVADTGVGIGEENLSRIFEPFFTTKEEGYGVGLGLSTVYGIMERHGGGVSVRSSPGKGAAFLLRLPVKKPDLP